MSEWRKVSELSPPLGSELLGWQEEFGLFVFYYDNFNLDDDGKPLVKAKRIKPGAGVEYEVLEYEEEYPTHWMPLPEAPGHYVDSVTTSPKPVDE